MDKQSNSNKAYWRMVRRLAWKQAWERAEVRAVIFALVSLLLGIGILGCFASAGIVEYPLFEDNAISNGILGITSVFVSILWLVYLYNRLLSDIPPKLHHEQQIYIDQLKAEIEGLQEASKPKPELYVHSLDSLNLVVVPDCPSHFHGWLTFRLHNRSKLEIQDCYAELVEVIQLSGSEFEGVSSQWLMWSSDHQEREGRKDIRAGSHFRVDIAAPHRNRMVFQTQNGRFFAPPGAFRASIIIHGAYNTTSFEYPFYLDFTYEIVTGFACEKMGRRSN